MSLRDCIEVGQDVGALTKEQADAASKIYEDYYTEHSATMGAEEAAAKAAKDTVMAIKNQVSEKARVRLLQAKSWETAYGNIMSFKNGEDLGEAAVRLISSDEQTKYSGIANRQQAVRGQIDAKMSDVLATFRRKGVTGRIDNKDIAEDLVKVAFGEEVDNVAAKNLYKSWSDAIEYARLRFNRAGGAIPRMEGWGLPQMHDSLELRKAGYNEWRQFITPLLDTSKMINPLTKQPFTLKQLEDALKASYDAILTDGWSKVKEGESKHSVALYNKGKNHRFLVFKDSESWMSYQERFGNPHPFITMMNYVDNISRDIAMIEVLGPNPNSTLRQVKSLVMRDAQMKDLNKKKTPNVNEANRKLKQLDAMYGIVSGASSAPIDGTVARGFAGARAVLTSVQLGGATLAAIPGDLATQFSTRIYNGMGETKLLKNILKQLNPLNVEERGKAAIQAGLVAESWTNVAAAQARYVGDMTAPEIAQNMSEVVMRASLLSPWTQAGRWAFGLEFMGHFANHVDKPFKELPSELQNTLKRSGLDVSWDIIRKAEIHEDNGLRILRPEEIAEIADVKPEVADELATRFLELINIETNYAVPTASVKGRAALVGETKAGTFVGEISRSIAQYKNFPITIFNTHIMRTLSEQTLKGKFKYGSAFLISTTLMGALALQMKEISNGRDPRTMNDKKFWASAMMQGGGLGIYGDFLFSDLNRHGNSLAQQILGPTAELGGDVLKLTMGNLQELFAGKDTNFAKEVVQFGTKYFPAKSLWYARLAVQRMFFENLQEWADPKARSKMIQLQNKYRRETGQEYWWKPGEEVPDRAPEMSEIFEEPPRR